MERTKRYICSWKGVVLLLCLFLGMMLFILLGMGEKPLMLCGAFTLFNIIKFVFVYSSLGALTGGLLCLAKKRLS